MLCGVHLCSLMWILFATNSNSKGLNPILHISILEICLCSSVSDSYVSVPVHMSGSHNLTQYEQVHTVLYKLWVTVVCLVGRYFIVETFIVTTLCVCVTWFNEVTFMQENLQYLYWQNYKDIWKQKWLFVTPPSLSNFAKGWWFE